MGQRANLVIFENQNWQLYYDHWCANRLDIELFWGPDIAKNFIQQRQPLDSKNSWLNSVWCEGGCIIDFDIKLLLWFGGIDILYSIPLRRAYLALQQEQWEGWIIQWANNGIIDLGAYLEVPALNFVSKYHEPDQSEHFYINQNYPADNNLLLTVQEKGRSQAAQISGNEEGLELGIHQLETLLSFPRSNELKWIGDEFPVKGIHLDLDHQTLYFWIATYPVTEIDKTISQAWYGWNYVNLDGKFEKQINLAKTAVISLPLYKVNTHQLNIIQRIRLNLNKQASNPAQNLLDKMDENTQLNLATFESRGSFGSVEEKLERLNELEKRIPIHG
ncbi:MAG: hypothetical protein AAF490_06055 [Chloroflexota bacterium]